MEIIVNGIPAEIKKGSSFQYISENRSFTASDGYTLSIAFPMKRCAQNIAIFGHIHRADITTSKVVCDCVIRYKDFVKYGSLTITGVSNNEIKGQFLEGRSAQNYDDTLDEIFINELDLDSPVDITPQGIITGNELAYKCWPTTNYVALPWVNNTFADFIQNDLNYINGEYHWDPDKTKASYQPYLIYIIEQICKAIDYKCDIQCLKDSNYKYLIICNSIPAVWNMPAWNNILPHWSVTEFFEEIEKLLNVEFDINNKESTIKCNFQNEIMDNIAPITLEVLDDFSVDISTKKDNPDFVATANVAYANCDNRLWKFYDAQNTIKNDTGIIEYENFGDLVKDAKIYRSLELAPPEAYPKNLLRHVLYSKDIDTYFILRVARTEEVNVMGKKTYRPIRLPSPINQFGPRVFKDESDNIIESKIVPVWIDETIIEKGNCIFLNVNNDSNDQPVSDSDNLSDIKFWKSPVEISLESETNNDKPEMYDKLYVAYWNGQSANKKGFLFCPIIDRVMMQGEYSYSSWPFSLRLNENSEPGVMRSSKLKISTAEKYNFKFLSKSIPNPRALFYINNKRYVCAKLTAQFSEMGLSELITGEFYQVS